MEMPTKYPLWGRLVWCRRLDSSFGFREADEYMGADNLLAQCLGGIKFIAKISLSVAPYFVVLSALADRPQSIRIFMTIN